MTGSGARALGNVALLAALAAAASGVPCARADTDAASSSAPPAPAARGVADAVHDSMSAGLLSSAQWLDSFFGDERIDIEENETNFRVWYSFFVDTEGDLKYGPRARLRLVLPQLQNKLHIVIGGEREEDKPAREVDAERQRDKRPPDDGEVSASVRYFFAAARKTNFSVKLGLFLNSLSPEVVLEPRFRHERGVGGAWLLRFTQSAYWSSKSGFGESTRFDLERPVLDTALVRSTVEGIWEEDVAGYTYFLKLALFQPLDPKRALEYLWANEFVTSPWHRLEEVVFAVKYRQRIWREWLAFEVTPQLDFARDEGFKAVPGIWLVLEATVGSTDWPARVRRGTGKMPDG